MVYQKDPKVLNAVQELLSMTAESLELFLWDFKIIQDTLPTAAKCGKNPRLSYAEAPESAHAWSRKKHDTLPAGGVNLKGEGNRAQTHHNLWLLGNDLPTFP
jgi:hypothetical protein